MISDRNGILRNELCHILVPFILEDGAADGHTKGIPEGTQEDECGGGVRDIVIWLTGLDGELEGGEEDSGADAHNHKDDDTTGGGDGGVEQEEQTAGDEGDDPADPDGDTEAEHDGYDDACNGGGGSGGEGDGQGIDAGLKGGVDKDGLALGCQIMIWEAMRTQRRR